MLKVLQSNRLEILASHLGKEMGAVPGTGLELCADTVIVPNPGMARWLWLCLAREHGISANLDCVLPGSFIWRVFHRLLPAVPQRSPYEPDIMTWRLHRLLRATKGDPEFADLLQWRDTNDDRRRFEFAQRLARLFDQYIVYRPEWVEQWRKGENAQSGWQQRLWSRLADEIAEPDWMGLRRQLDSIDPEKVTKSMPGRISLFGIPLLSPGYMEVLTWLSKHVDVHLYLPNPCREHWADIIPESEFGRVAGVADEKTLYIESGNALLASWGAQARDLLDLIQHLEPCVEQTEFHPAGHDTILHAVQTQILELTDPGTDDEQPAESAQPADRSIQVHVCHSPTRELEVLHDQLLGLFDHDSSLSASDVMVMTPDIEGYAPIIDAVFATPNRIPFNVADVNPRRGMALIATFMSLFDLSRERFDANHVLTILAAPVVRRRFGLAETDLPQIYDWVRDTGVRWGLDAGNRAEFGRDDAGVHSWRHGLNRLLLGFAMPGERVGTFAGVLPHDNVEGSAGLILGCLAEFITRLASLVDAIKQPRTASDWADCLNLQLETLFDVGEDQESEAQTLRDAINSLAQYANLAGHAEEIGIELVVDWLAGQLDKSATMRGFLGHGVTFCGIVPMRSVPSRIVCLIGLNDGVFPRIERPAGYDLIAAKPRRGDRSRRDDDRQAFLECLLNARDVFYLSYVGRDVRDDSPIPPSVLVNEVIDYCNRSFVAADGQSVGDNLITWHRVQAFSTRYFDASDPRLFSYANVLSQTQEKLAESPDFLTGPLESAQTGLLTLSLDDLTKFYKNPTKVFLQKRLDISYEGESEQLQTDDPVSLVGLEKWQTGELFLNLLDAGHSRDEILEIALNDRNAPVGRVGGITLAAQMREIEQTWEALQAFRPEGEPAAIDFDFRDGELVLTGRLADLYQSGQYLSRHGKTRPRFLVNLWVRHLVLNIEKPADVGLTSYWRADNDELHFEPLDDAQAQLRVLLQLYHQGLSEPLPFFSESSWIYAESLNEKGDPAVALSRARNKYSETNQFFDYNEESDPYVNRVFRNGVDWDRFADIAMQVYGPIIGRLKA